MTRRKKRLDELLVELGYYRSTADALGPVMAGEVRVNGRPCTKVGQRVPEDADIRIKGMDTRYASRGGYKLERALSCFGIDVTGKMVLDAGASTGGFTDCLLQHGAAKVYAVDVGYGQLRGRLAADPRVVALERTNIGDLAGGGKLAEAVDLCTVDLSYLSLVKAIPILYEVVGDVEMICLVKPLYEGLAEERKDDIAGIVEVAGALLRRLAEGGYRVLDVIVSPLIGGRGAVEFLVRIARRPGAVDVDTLLAKLQRDREDHPPVPIPISR